MQLSVLAVLGGWCAHKEVILLLGVGGGKIVPGASRILQARVTGCVIAQHNPCYLLSRAVHTLRLPEGSFDFITCHILGHCKLQ